MNKLSKRKMNYMLKLFKKFIVTLLLFIYCSSPTKSKYDSSTNHNISKDGAKHKNDLHSPLENCISCHGNDLRGGTSGVSC